MRSIASSVLAMGLGVLGSAGVASAQPAPASNDVSRAKQLYQSAEREIGKGLYSEAAKDYGAAFELTKDPVLFFKIASANEKAGRCDVAVIYYRRYLKEAKPAEKFVAVTKERIAVCGATVEPTPVPVTPVPVTPTPVTPVPVPPVTTTPATTPMTSTSTSTVGSTSTSTSTPTSHTGAWVAGAAAVVLVAGGAIFEVGAHDAENDLTTFYGAGGSTPTFNPATQSKYNDLVDRGDRDRDLSLVSFGLGAVAAGTSIFLFAHHHHEESVMVIPTASAHTAGAAVGWAF